MLSLITSCICFSHFAALLDDNFLDQRLMTVCVHRMSAIRSILSDPEVMALQTQDPGALFRRLANRPGATLNDNGAMSKTWIGCSAVAWNSSGNSLVHVIDKNVSPSTFSRFKDQSVRTWPEGLVQVSHSTFARPCSDGLTMLTIFDGYEGDIKRIASVLEKYPSEVKTLGENRVDFRFVPNTLLGGKVSEAFHYSLDSMKDVDSKHLEGLLEALDVFNSEISLVMLSADVANEEGRNSMDVCVQSAQPGGFRGYCRDVEAKGLIRHKVPAGAEIKFFVEFLASEWYLKRFGFEGSRGVHQVEIVWGNSGPSDFVMAQVCPAPGEELSPIPPKEILRIGTLRLYAVQQGVVFTQVTGNTLSNELMRFSQSPRTVDDPIENQPQVFLLGTWWPRRIFTSLAAVNSASVIAVLSEDQCLPLIGRCSAGQLSIHTEFDSDSKEWIHLAFDEVYQGLEALSRLQNADR